MRHPSHEIKNTLLTPVNGIIFIIVGILTILIPLIWPPTMFTLIVATTLASGIIYAIQAFYSKKWSVFLWSLFASIIAIVTSTVFISPSLCHLWAYAFILVLFLFIQGINKTALATLMRQHKGWQWFVASGVISIILGIMFWYALSKKMSMPIWTLSLLIGIDSLITGCSLIVFIHQTPKQNNTHGS